jgi:hypothetical protein
VLRRADLGIPAPEIDERLPLEPRVLGDTSEQRREVLLRKPFEPVRTGPHRAIVRGQAVMTILDNLTKLAKISAMTEPLASLDFSRAKASLSELMTEVVHKHSPRVVSRHRGKEEMVLVGSDDLASFLDSFRFDTLVTIAEGEVTAELSELGVLGFGETLEEAMEDLVEELRVYARDFFERASFYAETDRAGHAPWLLRFALTNPDRQLELLYEDSRQTAAPTA